MAIAFLIFLILICVVYAVRTKLVDLMVILLSVAFFLLIVLGIVGVFIPSVFTKLSDISLKASGTYEKILEIDKSIPGTNISADLKESSNSIVNDVIAFFTGNNDENQNTEDSEFSEIEIPSESNMGILEKNLYPSLVSTVAFIYRALSILVSIAGLITIVYLSYATAGVTDIYKLKKRISELEGRTINLENAVFPPPQPTV
ncbi:hypothetical protein GF357_02185 [Candidatus Dojkabacteria bacterium]|nr:hypothetical protein [Candidatus Dojkabacteria bacterium]